MVLKKRLKVIDISGGWRFEQFLNFLLKQRRPREVAAEGHVMQLAVDFEGNRRYASPTRVGRVGRPDGSARRDALEPAVR